MKMQPARLLLAAALVLAVGACKKKEEPSPAMLTPPPPPPPPPTVSLIEVGKRIGPNRRVTDTTSTFGTKDTLYVSVVTESTMPTSALMAKWRFVKTGQLVDSTMQVVAAPDSANKTTVTEFHVAKPKGWPVGRYSVEILLDGRSVGAQEIEVKR